MNAEQQKAGTLDMGSVMDMVAGVGLVSAHLPRQFESMIPGVALPAEDVGGQNFADIPRFT